MYSELKITTWMKRIARIGYIFPRPIVTNQLLASANEIGEQTTKSLITTFPGAAYSNYTLDIVF